MYREIEKENEKGTCDNANLEGIFAREIKKGIEKGSLKRQIGKGSLKGNWKGKLKRGIEWEIVKESLEANLKG